MIDDIKFVHPKDVQDGNIELSGSDITTNLPFVEGVHICFDHHSSEKYRVGQTHPTHILDPDAPSAARVLYEYYGAKTAFPNISDEMMLAVDKADSGKFNKEDILNPQGWMLMNFIMDARTGLGRFKAFNISNYQLMMNLIDYCKNHDIGDILKLPDVVERTDLYFEQTELFCDQLRRCTKMDGNVAVIRLKNEEIIYAGNRFMVYVLFPDCTVSLHVMWGYQKQNTALTAGKSIFNRNSNADLGQIMLSYGGGGHKAVATCQVDNGEAEDKVAEIVKKINAAK